MHPTAIDYAKYLKETLIPDLKASGMSATAEDFEEAIYWIQESYLLLGMIRASVLTFTGNVVDLVDKTVEQKET